jgi:hypothetical protein
VREVVTGNFRPQDHTGAREKERILFSRERNTWGQSLLFEK